MLNRVLKVISFGIFLLLLALPSMAQNTKGDKASSNRETRFKKTSKQKPAKRIRSKRTTSSLRAYKPRKQSKGGERAGRPVSPLNSNEPSDRPRNVFPQSKRYVNNSSQSAKDKRQNQRTPRVNVRSASGRTRNVFPQTGRYVNHSSTRDRKPPRARKVVPRSASSSFIARRSTNSWAHYPRPKQKRERAYKGDITGRRIRTKNFETRRPPIVQGNGGLARQPRAGKNPNVYSQKGGYVNNFSRQPRRPRTVSNNAAIAKLNQSQSNQDRRPRRKAKVVPRSASRAYIARRSTNVWAHYPRPKKKGERAITTDLAGKPLRTKNFETQRPRVLVNPTARPHRVGKSVGDRPYSGPASGGYQSASRSGRAWRGDIAGRKIRGKNFSSKRRSNYSLRGSGFQSRSRSGERRTGKAPLPVKGPRVQGPGTYRGDIKSSGRKGFNNQGEEFTGNLKSRRRAQGGGSVSGRLWNNQGTAIPSRTPGMGANGLGKYQGNIRARNRRGFNDQGEEFTGNLKSRRPPKGGGSVSGKLWNNQGTAIPTRTPGVGANGLGKYQGNIRAKNRRGFNDQGEEFTGNLKSRRPPKGGGSVSGKLWNNQNTPIPARTPGVGANGLGKYQGNIRAKDRRGFNNQGEEYTGNIKTRRPPKGGGSVSGKLWNNRETAIPVRTPAAGSERIGSYQGNIKASGRRGFNNQGEEYTGNIKTKRPPKGGGSISGKLWNNKETPIPVRTGAAGSERVGSYQGNIKASGRRGFNNQGEEYTGNIKNRRGFERNPNSAEEALKKAKPSSGVFKTDGLQVRVKQPEYVKHPNSAKEALKVREPGRAVARIGDYQGNIKMRKYELFSKRGLHPDAKFVKLNKNNVAEEKDMLTNFKLWWARLFKKSDNQPEHLKDKRGKPRYDKGEAGLWYD